MFGLNGMGSYLLVSVIARDLLVVQSLVLLFAFVYVVINLIVDVAYAWLDQESDTRDAMVRQHWS